MDRQITITLDGVQYMMNVNIESQPSAIIYHVSPIQHFKDELPDTIDFIQPADADTPQYDTQQVTEKGRQIIHAIGEQLKTLPPQLKGGKGEGRI